jgi:hypothetical protein
MARIRWGRGWSVITIDALMVYGTSCACLTWRCRISAAQISSIRSSEGPCMLARGTWYDMIVGREGGGGGGSTPTVAVRGSLLATGFWRSLAA